MSGTNINHFTATFLALVIVLPTWFNRTLNQLLIYIILLTMKAPMLISWYTPSDPTTPFWQSGQIQGSPWLMIDLTLQVILTLLLNQLWWKKRLQSPAHWIKDPESRHSQHNSIVDSSTRCFFDSMYCLFGLISLLLLNRANLGYNQQPT